MEKMISKAFMLVLLILLTACDDLLNEKDDVKGSGNVIMLEKVTTPFNEIELGYAIEVELIQVPERSLQIWIDDNLERYIELQQGRSSLKLNLDDDNNYSNYTFRAKISTPDLVSLSASGASSIDLFNLENQHDMSINLSGASRLTGDLVTDDVVMSLSGASFVELLGSADDLDVSASGASVLRLIEFNVNDVGMTLSGASVATINANVVIDAELSGASILNWTGDAQIRNISSSGASLINRIDNP